MKKGIFATRLGDNYGRVMSQDRFNEMTDEEKKDFRLIKIYDDLLKARQTTNDQLFNARKRLTGFGEEFEKNKADKIARLEAQLVCSRSTTCSNGEG